MERIRKTLGLDLGSNSLGWAIVDSDKGTILDKGVVVFDEGIKREKGIDSLETPAAARRTARMGRRLKMRRRYRKFALLTTLINNDMCPLSIEALDNWKKKGVYPLEEFQFRKWLSSTPENNPYADRANAASQKVDKYTLGRALYHLVQRRGFLSNRKDKMKEDESDKNLGQVKGQIKELSNEIESFGKDATLGQYLYDCFKQGLKIRARYIGRKEHYEKEFDKIVEVQGLEPDLVEKLRKNIFYQRPLRSQKRLVGFCPLETKNRRCQIFRPEFEEFRMLSFINNLRVVDGDSKRKLSDDERTKAIKKFYVVSKYFKVKDLEKALGRNIKLTLNSEKSISSNSISQQLNNLFGTELDGFKQWHSNNGKYDYITVLDAISFFDDDEKLRCFCLEKLELDEERAEKLLKINIPEGYAKYSLKAINKILPYLRDGYDLYFSQLFAYLPSAIGEDEFVKNKDKIISSVFSLHADYKENCEAKKKNKNVVVTPFSTRLSDYLQRDFNVSDSKFDEIPIEIKISDYEDKRECGILPEVNLGMIRNPLVQRSMTILRRLVNQLRKSGKIDADTHINIELARSVNDRNRRMAYEEWQLDKEKERLGYAEKIRSAGQEPTEELILRWQLAEEQDWKCLYTGKQISQADVLNSGSEFDIEHTIPRSKSGDNSQVNKTLCFNNYNRFVKKGQLPTECPNYNQPVENYNAVISTAIRPWKKKVDDLEKNYESQLAKSKSVSSSNPEAKSAARRKALKTKLELDYWREKVRRFEITSDELGDGSGFMKRQLVDTGIMTKHAVEFLGSVYHSHDGIPNVKPVNGVAVAFARKEWGVQNTEEEKSRINHVHHAIDAMVIAELNTKRFNAICSILKDDSSVPVLGLEREVKPPFEDFGNVVHREASEILVRYISYHKEIKQTYRNKWDLASPIRTKGGVKLTAVPTNGKTVRAQLHNETFYGKIKSPETGEICCVVRKAIDSIEEKDVVKIVDPVVRKNMLEQIAEYKKENTGVKWKEMVSSGFWMKKPTVDNKIGVPIKKVRVYSKVSNPNSLKPQIFSSNKDYKNSYYVESAKGSNYVMKIYENDIIIDNILRWAQDKPINIPESFGQEIGQVSSGTMVIVYNNKSDLEKYDNGELSKQLFVVYMFCYMNPEKTIKRIYCKKSTEARPDKVLPDALKLSDFSKIRDLERFWMSPDDFLAHTLIEGIHFNLTIDGKIEWKKEK